MLFDLRGRGRRRTVKSVYITLAFLMGGGLVLFGIGGGGGVSGGLVDAITGAAAAATTARTASPSRRRPRSRRRRPTRRTRPPGPRSPAPASRSPAPATTSTRPRAPSPRPATPSCTAAGDAWEKYLALDPPKPDDRVASLMVQAFGRAQPARQGRRGAGGHHRRAARRRRPSRQLRDLRLPGRPDPQGRPREEQGARADRPGHARGAQGPARPGEADPRPACSRRRGPQRDPLASFYTAHRALVAQLAEQRTLNPKVPGSIPGGGIEQRPAFAGLFYVRRATGLLVLR